MDESLDYMRSEKKKVYTLIKYFKDIWNKHKQKDNADDKFTFEFYYIIEQLNEKLCQQQIKARSIHNDNRILTDLLPSNSSPKDTIIPKDTYQYLFSALRTQLEYKKINWLRKYWQKASAYRDYNKLKPKPDYEKSHDPSKKKENEDKTEKNKLNNQNFEEFHIWLATMVLFNKEYDLLDYMLTHIVLLSNEYPLVPSSFVNILEKCTEINKAMEGNFYSYAFYPLSNINNSQKRSENLKWVNKYLALLLFRLNTKDVSNQMFCDVWNEPELPKELNDLKSWLKYLKSLKKQVEFWSKKQDHKAFKILEIDAKLKADNNPLYKLENLISIIETNVKDQTINGELDKTSEFQSYTKKVIGKTIAYLKSFTREKKGNNYDEQFILQYKTELRKNEDYISSTKNASFNSTNWLADDTARALQNQFSLYFLFNKNIEQQASYRFYTENAFKAINKLVGKNKDKFFVIYFGIQLSLMTDTKNTKVEGLSKKTNDLYIYNGIEIHNFVRKAKHDNRGKLVVIPKDKLPFIETTEPSEEIIKKCFFDEKAKIDNEPGLYAGITKANDNSYLRAELLKENGVDENNVDLHCLVSIYYSYNIYWAMDMDAATIEILSEYIDEFKPSNLEDVKPLSLPKEEEK